MFKAGAGFHSGFMPLSINIIKNYTYEKTLPTLIIVNSYSLIFFFLLKQQRLHQ